MPWLTLVLAVVVAYTGGMAAWRWYEASEVKPIYPDPATLGELTRQPSHWLAESIAMNKAASLNKEAAIWTAVTVALTAISSIVTIFLLRLY